MRLSAATKQIIEELRRIADEYSLLFEIERPYFPEKGQESERVDAQFLLPSGRPALRFEIDNNPDRASHNRFKVFGDPYTLTSLPFISLAVHHGSAAVADHAYVRELLQQGFVVPPRFIGTVDVDTSSPATIRGDLSRWLNTVVDQLAAVPQASTVFGIAEEYQPLIANLSIEIAQAHLEVHAEFAWFLVARRRLQAERAACLSIALARMLQRAGYRDEAIRKIRELRWRLHGRQPLSARTWDELNAVQLLLEAPSFSSENIIQYMSAAAEAVHGKHHKAKFHWRKGILYALDGNARLVNETITTYLSMTDGSDIALSNSALLRTLASLCTGQGDPREFAQTYARRETFLLSRRAGAPDGTVHGVVSALYLKVLTAVRCGNSDAAELFGTLDAFCADINLPRTADGLREIGHVLPVAHYFPAAVRRETLGSLMSRGRKDRLRLLCDQVDIACE